VNSIVRTVRHVNLVEELKNLGTETHRKCTCKI
jgi:hypothetical protein